MVKRTILLLSLLIATLPGKPASAQSVDETMIEGFERIHHEAERIAGQPMDMPTRAEFLFAIYLDSKKNYAFPVIALHGALWGYRYFRRMDPIGAWILHGYGIESKSKEIQKERELEDFSESFQETNRFVFIDTYTNYYFSKTWGRTPGAEIYIHPQLLAALNEVHDAVRTGVPLTANEKKDVFKTALYYEQELRVGPRVREAVAAFQVPVLKEFALAPQVHFEYFPPLYYLFFRNFSDQNERIAKATLSYDLAVSEGWQKVESTIKNYGLISKEFFRDPESYTEHYRETLGLNETPTSDFLTDDRQ